jgi:hypothetical protein
MKHVGVISIYLMAWSAAVFGQDAISLYEVVPSHGNVIPAGDTIEFRFRVQVDTLHPGGLWVYSNGFQLYSPDGASWDTTRGRYLPGWLPFGDRSVALVNTDGSGADTVVFLGEDSAGGFWVEYDHVAWAIRIAIPDTPVVYGKTICLDSVMAPWGTWVSATWLWATLLEEYAPSWDGPHCLTISCCDGDGIRGNVDGLVGPGGAIDISDVNYLVAFLFQGGPPPRCVDEADAEALDAGVAGPLSVADLTYLIGYLFQGGPAPPPCP